MGVGAVAPRRRNDLISASTILLIVGALSVITFTVGDGELFLAVNEGVANPALDIFCAYIVPAAFMVYSAASVAALLFLDGKNSRRAVMVGVAVALISGFASYGLGRVLKVLFGRPRPFEVLPARIVGPWHASVYSFPSTTTMLAFGFALPILFERPRLGLPLVVLAALIGFSVVYTGFHYPSDVLAGAAISTILAVPIYRLKKTLMNLLAVVKL